MPGRVFFDAAACSCCLWLNSSIMANSGTLKSVQCHIIQPRKTTTGIPGMLSTTQAQLSTRAMRIGIAPTVTATRMRLSLSQAHQAPAPQLTAHKSMGGRLSRQAFP